MHRTRKSGVLLHPTSLPGPGGIGSLGNNAINFINFLHDAGQSLWQVLPLGPTAYGNSPYACYSAFAGNPLLINLDLLVEQGDLDSSDLDEDFPAAHIDFPLVADYKRNLLRKAATGFFAAGDAQRTAEFVKFRATHPWLHDFALFMALKDYHHGKSWCDWPEDVSRRMPDALALVTSELAEQIDEHSYMQWQFFRQWHKIREYANRQGISIVGDIPIFVAYDSADVWVHPDLFHLNEKGRPTVVAGVPPDYFSKTGQLWGNPLYNWELMAYRGYDWWIDRFRSALDLCDVLRVDHFRGFEAYWEVPAADKIAVNGRWVKGPGEALFHALFDALGQIPIIAEDLGVITPDVEALRDKFSFPGMKILQFAFGSGPHNPYLPHNHVRESVVYTGTHDNDTTVGWFASLATRERQAVCRYLNVSEDGIAWSLIRSALASVADTVILPLQDVLELAGDARMNLPGTSSGNWTWRYNPESLDDITAKRMLELTELYGRCQAG
jgi:4-alpha-glucanotransferase